MVLLKQPRFPVVGAPGNRAGYDPTRLHQARNPQRAGVDPLRLSPSRAAAPDLAWERVLWKSGGFSHDDPGEDPEPPGPRLTAFVPEPPFGKGWIHR
jgi:hypothetical protein